MLVLASTNCIAQTDGEALEEKPFIDWDALYAQKYIGIGALGVIKYPGLEVNLSFPHKFIVKEKMHKGKEKRINKVRRWELFSRYYFHKNNHHNVMLTGGRTWQRELKKNKFFISQADIGLARTFYTNPTYAVENGIVTRQNFDGDMYFSFNYRFGFGQHIQRKNETFRFYSYFGLMNFAPYNNLYLSRLVVGININKFLKKK